MLLLSKNLLCEDSKQPQRRLKYPQFSEQANDTRCHTSSLYRKVEILILSALRYFRMAHTFFYSFNKQLTIKMSESITLYKQLLTGNYKHLFECVQFPLDLYRLLSHLLGDVRGQRDTRRPLKRTTPLPYSPQMTFLMSRCSALGVITHLLSTGTTEHNDFIRRVVPERGRKRKGGSKSTALRF